MKACRQNGFTLIELMITVVVIGILASIAYPSYTQYVLRGHRAAAQAEMMDIANRQQQFLLSNRAYATQATLEASGYSLPSAVSARYDYAIAVNASPKFTITFKPKGAQTSDGVLLLDSTGLKTRAGDTAKW